MTDGFIEVYAKSTGLKQTIPEHWLDDPYLGRDFSRTPSARSRELEATATPTPDGGLTAAVVDDPDESWTRDRLNQHAAGLGVDTTSLPNKAEVLQAIQAASTTDDTQISDDNPSSDQTPAAGENQE